MPGLNEGSRLAILVSDTQAGLWDLDTKALLYDIGKHHQKGSRVTDVSFHPLTEYAVVSSTDCTWSFHNLVKGVKLGQFKEDQEITAIQMHPDGLVMAAGFKNGAVKIYDVRD